MKMPVIVVVLVAVAALIAGCGEGSGAETSEAPTGDLPQVRIALNGRPRPDNVGVVLAEAYRHFSDAGLEVVVHEPLTPGRAFRYGADGTADVSIVHLPEVVLGQDRGAQAVAIASVITEPTAAMIWLRKSKIDGIADLEGKTIAVPGLRYEWGFLKSLLARGRLTLADVNLEVVEYNLLPALISGRADAIFGGSWNVEGAELEARGLEPVITRVQDLGVPSYEELVLVARRDRLSEDPQSIRDLIAAMASGTAEALEDPRTATEAVAYRIDRVPGKVTKAEFDATLPLLSESGQMNEEKARQLVEWMYEEGLIKRKQPVSAFLTNEYLPQP